MQSLQYFLMASILSAILLFGIYISCQNNIYFLQKLAILLTINFSYQNILDLKEVKHTV